METQPPIAQEIDAACARVIESCKARSAAIEQFMASQPPTVRCPAHPGIERRITREATQEASAGGLRLVAGYEPCPECTAARVEREMQDRLRGFGVPGNLLRASFENWEPANSEEAQALIQVRQFATAVRRGFLILLGPMGNGKSHLAVGVLRYWRSGVFTSQNGLLRKLRATYRDRGAVDPVEKCQGTGLLVVDDVGLSSGGRDELPMLHEILDHRHGERKPSVITGNVDWGGLLDVVGERLGDRLRESAHRIITLAGDSRRAAMRQKYFEPGL